LPDKGERIRCAIKDIETCLGRIATSMDYDSVTDRFHQMSMSSTSVDVRQATDHLDQTRSRPVEYEQFSDEHLNEVKQRLRNRQAQRAAQNNVSHPKLVSLDETIRLFNDEKARNEVGTVVETTMIGELVRSARRLLDSLIFIRLREENTNNGKKTGSTVESTRRDSSIICRFSKYNTSTNQSDR
jgi:hypothetical protein